MKLTGTLGCIGAIAIALSIYCLKRAENKTLLLFGILSVIVAAATIGFDVMLVRQYIKNKYR